MSVSLGLATAADVPALAALTARGAHDPLSEEQLLAECQRPYAHMITATMGETGLVGYVLYWHVADEVEIHDMVVDPDHRRRGLGRAMFQQVISTAKTERCSHIVLDVRETNVAAIALYRSLGFESVGTRPNYYRRGQEDAVLMRLTLEGTPAGA